MTLAGADTTGFDAADEAQFFDAIDRWIERDLKPIAKEYDHADRYPAHVVEQMKDLGLFGATIGAEYGGLGLPATTYAQLVMRISSVWMSITGIFNSHLMLALAVEKFGTRRRRTHCLPKLASGEIRGGLALTEPDAGTDLQGIRMTARARWRALRDQRHEDLDHERHRRVVRRAAREDEPDAEPRHKGMSLFIAPKMAGLHGRQEARQARLQAIDSAELVFDELSRAGRSLDRRHRRPGVLPGHRRARARPDQRRRARRRHRGGRACSSRRSTRRRARRSASRSASTRRSSSSSPTWRRAPARHACSRWMRPPRSTAASAATSKPAWPSISHPKPRSRTASSRCAFTAPTAIRRSTTSSASTATRRSR